MEVEEDKNEAVYSSGEESGTTVMSERVSNLANSIYSEFERMIHKYDQDVVSGLMPLMVSVLEQLDSAYGDNNEQLVELEILSDDNEQLITQYEREKQLRKLAENRYLEIEDQIEAEKRNADKDIESLGHDNRGLGARVKSYKDHVERLEERISEMKREYSSLHERHTGMVQHYMDRIERAERRSTSGETPQKGSIRIRTLSSGNSARSPVGPVAGSISELIADDVNSLPKSPDVEMLGSPPFSKSGNENNLSLRDESLANDLSANNQLSSVIAVAVPDVHRVQKVGSESSDSDVHVVTSTTCLVGSPDAAGRGSRSSTVGSDINNSTCSITDVDNLPIMSARDAANMLTPGSPDTSITVLSKDAAAILASTPELVGNPSPGAEITWRDRGGGTKRPISLDLDNLPEGVTASSLFAELACQEPDVIGQMDTGADITAMGRELENVMKENKDLVGAKGKLVTQKTDLLKRVEELSNEKEVLVEELDSVRDARQRMNMRVSDCEQELKRTKHEAEKATVALKEASVSAAHRKRFTRVEMARVLMERNQYKERLMELQEAVRWTEMIRASKERNLELQQKKKTSIWKFFSNLFGPSPRRPHPTPVSIRYNTPQGGGNSTHRRHNSLTNLNTGSSMAGGFGSENFDRERLNERRERYKQVRAYLNTDLSEGRMQAYGWSLPAKYSSEVAEGGKSLVSVPIPVYCRPLNLSDPGMKIWCSAGVDLSGGKTQDGGAAIGASIFYAESACEGKEAELQEAKPSMVWIGSSTHSCSKITIIDANYPQNILDCFVVCTSHLLCITAVPGAIPTDYDITEAIDSGSDDGKGSTPSIAASQDLVTSTTGSDFSDPLGAKVLTETGPGKQVSDTPTVKDVSTSESDRQEPKSDVAIDKMSSVLPTMWLGAQSGCVYVHSAISQWRTCIQSIRLKDSVLSIVHVKGRVLVALADGTVAIFHRSSDGQWNFNNYHLLDLGRPHHSIRCMAMVHEKVWCGYRNKIQVIHPRTMRVEKTFDAHPRRESQVRQLAWIGDGVWVSIRLDSTLRLYNAQTFHHLQDIDIEPYVSKMLGTGKLGFSFVRITSLLLTNDRLWVGTGNGVILSVPLVAARPARDDGEQLPMSGLGTGGPGGPVRVYSNEGKDGEPLVSSSSFMPYCSMVNAQLSFHGHRDSVKFFAAVQGSMKRATSTTTTTVSTQTQTSSKPTSPSQTPPNTSPEKKIQDMMLVLSGGEGYVDFRLGDGEEAAVEDATGDLISVTIKGQSTSERSHIMVWQVPLN